MIKKDKVNSWYNKNYRKTLIFSILLLVTALLIIGINFSKTGDILPRDVSLTGGTSITVSSAISISDAQKALSAQIPDVEVQSLSDNAGNQKQLIITTSEDLGKVQPIIENYLGVNLTNSNSSIESTGSSLGKDFYKQLMIAIVIAFFWMAAVVFVIFSKKLKIKLLVILINLLFGFFLGEFFFSINIFIAAIVFLAFAASLIYIYIKYSIPSFAVMSCAFADITMTLAVIILSGMKLSAAGVVAFLMLIGYSVDTDILLTTRVLRRKMTSVNHEIFSSFKTGMTMTLAAIAAVAVALISVSSYKTSLNQIFIILLIGFIFDMLNTWITNTALIKWFVESSESK